MGLKIVPLTDAWAERHPDTITVIHQENKGHGGEAPLVGAHGACATQAREQLNVTTIVYANRSYDILRIELHRVGALKDGGGPGPKTNSLLDLGNPSIDFVRIAEGMGVPSRRVDTAEALADAMRWAFEEPGPHLIEAVVPSLAG